MANRVNVDIGFNIDEKGLIKLQSAIQNVARMTAQPGQQMDEGLKKAVSTASTLEGILKKTYNSDLGSLNVIKFNQELSKSGLTLKDLKSNLSGAGNQGATAFNEISRAILGTNAQLKQSSKLLDNMFITFKNTVRYGISSSIFNNVANSIQKAYDYSIKLDTSLNNIRIVTDKSAESMSQFAEDANTAAKQLGASTLDYTNAALIYYQQGLSDEEAKARAETTIKTANVTGQTGAEVSELLTSVWNGYKVSAEETELYVDKLAAVAATTAADLEELSSGMSKVAAAANAMGVDFDDLNAQIATIVSVTRQAPESVGTALKTIYARIGDLKVDGVDEFGVSLGDVSSKLATMGVQILDQNGEMRDMTSIMTEVAEKWNDWTRAQQQAAAVAIAGKRQYNNLIALFENWDMYTDALETSANAMGTLQQQNDIYMESTAAKLKVLKATWQDLYNGVIDEDELNTGIEGLTNLVQVFDNFMDSFGGGIKAVSAFGAVLSSIFNKQIASSINNAIQRQEVFKNNLALAQAQSEMMKAETSTLGANATPKQQAAAAAAEVELEYAKQIYEVRAALSQEEAKELIDRQNAISKLEEEAVLIEKTIQKNEAEILGGIEQVNTLLFGSEEELNQIDNEYIKQEELLENNIKKQQEQIALLKKAEKEVHTQFTAYEDIEKIKENILNRTSVLEEKDRDLVSSSLEQLSSKEDILEVENNILAIIESAISASKGQLEIEKQNTIELQKQEASVDRALAGRSKIDAARESQNNLKQEAEELLRLARNGRSVVETVTTITSTLGNLAMAWGSINSLFQTLNDETASIGDKITQTFMTIGFTLPIVISNFKKLNDTLGLVKLTTAGLQAQTDLELAKTTASTLAHMLNGETISKETKEKTLNNAATLAGASADLVAAAAAGDEAAMQEILNKVLEKQIAIRATLKKEMLASFATFLKSPVGIAIIAITTLTAAIVGVVKAIEKWHKEQIELNKEILEESKVVEDQAKANKELVSSFDDLFKQYKELKNNQEDTTAISENLRNKTLELAEAYDIEGASLLALGENYDILNKKIKDAREQELKESLKAADEGAKAASKTLSHEMTKGAGYIAKNAYNNTLTIDAGEIDGAQRLREATSTLGLQDNLTETIVEGQGTTYQYKIHFDIDNAEQAEKELKHINDLITYYQTRYSEQELGSDYFYQELLKEQEQFSEQYGELVDQLAIKYATETELAFNKIDFSNLSLEEAYRKIQEVKEKLSEDIPEDKLNKYVNDAIADIDELKEHAVKLDLAERISEETGQSIEEILNIIKDFNNSDLALLNLHLESALLDGDLQAWVDRHTPILLQAQLNTTNDQIKEALGNYNEKKGFKQEDIDSIFSQFNATEAVGFTAQDFNELDYGDQLQVLTEAWINNTKAIVDGKEEIIQSLQQEIDKIKEEQEALQKRGQIAEKVFREQIEKNENLTHSEEEYKEAIINLAKNGYNKLDSSQRALIDSLEKETYFNEELLEDYGDIFNQIDNLNAAYDGYISELNKVQSTEENHAQNADFLRKATAAQSAVLDDIQAAYKSLNSVIDEYNESGSFTIDMVQQLMTMDDAYVATLSFENGQLTLNESAFQALTIAKIDDMEQTAVLTAQEELEALAEREVADASMSATSAILNAAAAANEASAAAIQGAAAWDAYAASMRAAAGVSGSAYDAKAKQITDALQNRLIAAENAKTQIKKGGSSMKKAMGGGGSKGGKGGGGSKEKERKQKEGKNLDDELDRYWEINKAIAAVDKSLKYLEKDKKNLANYELIDALRQENELLEKQEQEYQRLLEAQKQEASEKQSLLKGDGVTFDENGKITNYAEAVTNALNQYNNAVAAYNSGALDEAGLEVAEKLYEGFKKDLDRYDKLYYTEMENTLNKIDDLQRKKLENNLKAWEVEIDVKLNLKEMERDWNDFLKEITSDFKSVYKDLRKDMEVIKKNTDSYLGDSGTIQTDLNAIKEVTEEIDKINSGQGSNMFESVSQAQEKLKELDKQLQDDAKNMHKLWEDAWETYLDGIDEVADGFDDLADQFEQINDELNFQSQLIELLYGDEAYKMMNDLFKGQEKAAMNQIQSLKAEKDMWEELWRASGATMENQSTWTEDQKKYYEEWQEAQSNLNDKVLEYIQLLKDDYLNTVHDVLQELEHSITGSSLDRISTQWERISDYASKYYDDVEGAYEIQTFANKIDKDIASTTELKNQQKLQKFRDKEIDYLREKENLTQYDLDAAEARYQILLKEMALEDAQNNKTSMKLTRNEQGNWSYQYIADEGDLATKREELLNAYNDLYQLASDAYEANIESLQELQEKYLESAAEIYENENLAEEEKQARLLELRQWYLEQYKLLAEENSLYRDELALASAALLNEIYNQDYENYKYMTDSERELLDTLVDAHIKDFMDLEEKIKDNYNNMGNESKRVMKDTRDDWSSSAQQIANTWNADDGKSVKAQVQAAYKKIEEANSDYQDKVNKCAVAVKRDFGPNGVKGAIDKAADATDGVRERTEELVRQSGPYLDALRNYVDQVAVAWVNVQQQIVNAINLLAQYVNAWNTAWSSQVPSASVSSNASQRSVNPTKSSNSNSSTNSSTNSGRNTTTKSTEPNDLYYGTALDRVYAMSPTGNYTDWKKNTAMVNAAQTQQFTFASGGYTGAWGSSGKLAVLHEKELVLNADDTKNILATVKGVRDIASYTQAVKGSVASSIAGMIGSVSNRFGVGTTSNTNTDNIFNITAEFPNASNVDEIREAILTLPNIASQYIGRQAI